MENFRSKYYKFSLTDIKLLLREVSEFYKNIQLILNESVHLALKTIQGSNDWNIETQKKDY